MRRTLITLAILSALALGACGGDSDDEPAPSAGGTTAATTAPLAPDEAFLADADRLIARDNPEAAQAALDLAHSTCDALDVASPGALAADDAAHDSPQSDAEASEALTSVAIATVFDGVPDQDAAAVVLVLAGEHLCPQHASAIDAGILARGVALPDLAQ